MDCHCGTNNGAPRRTFREQNTKWKILAHSGTWDFKSDALPTELAGLVECCPYKWPYYIHVLPIPMNTLLLVRVDGQRILSCTCTVFVTYLNIYKYFTKSKETKKFYACFQHANTVKHSTWSGICMLTASTGRIRLFVICTIYTSGQNKR